MLQQVSSTRRIMMILALIVPAGLMVCIITSCVSTSQDLAGNGSYGSATVPKSSVTSWASAKQAGTPSAFGQFFKKHPDSPHFKTQKATLRGRYWFRINDRHHRDGVIVTVKDTDLLTNVPLEEAVRLGVIGSQPARSGFKTHATGVTFNYLYGEIVEGGIIVPKEIDGKVVSRVIEPKDYINATIVLTSDGTDLLTWDLRKAIESTRPGTKPTFVRRAASRPPFNDLLPGLDKGHTPKSQSFNISRQQP